MSDPSIESLASLINEAAVRVAALQAKQPAAELAPKLRSEWLLGPNPSVDEKKKVVREVMAAIDPNMAPLGERDRFLVFWDKHYPGHTLRIGSDFSWYQASPAHGLFGLFPGFFGGLFQAPEKRSLPLLIAYLELFPAYLQWARKYATFRERIATLEQDFFCAKVLNAVIPDKLENSKRPREVDEHDEDEERGTKHARTHED